MDFQSIVVDVGIVVPGASSAVIADAGAASTRVAGMVAGAGAATGTVVAAGVSVGAGTGAIVGVGMIVVGMRIEMGMRYAIRAIMIWLFATLRFLFLMEFGRCPKIGGKIISSSIP